MRPFLAMIGAAMVFVVAAESLRSYEYSYLFGDMPVPLPLPFGILGNDPPIALAAVYPLLFLIWLRDWWLFVKEPPQAPFSWKTWKLFLVVLVFSFSWYLLSWGYGVQYQGLEHCVICCAFSLVFAVLSFIFCSVAWSTQRIFPSFLAHVAIFSWIASFAFPFFGESP